ncbi:MAG TPA: hypothetical protein VFX31_01635 [Ktedonobacterales bacterium]|nr:hypothetical protein [Ktedonobacterales bacterium]
MLMLNDALRDLLGEWGPALWLGGWGLMLLVGYALMDLDYDRKSKGRDD